MADLISSISALTQTLPTSATTNLKPVIAEVIKNSIVDSVNFSQNSRNLYQISQIDNQINSILGVDNPKDSISTKDLKDLALRANELFNNGSLTLNSANFSEIVDIVRKLHNSDDPKTTDKIATLTNTLYSFTQLQALNSLSVTPSDSIFSSNSINSLLQTTLFPDQLEKLGDIAPSLSQVLFSGSNRDGESFLERLGSIYGLNSLDDEGKKRAITLLNSRNSLLSSIVINSDIFSTYQKI